MKDTKFDTQKYLDTAFSIASKLARTAIWDGERCNWLGSASEVHNGTFTVVDRTFAPDLYSGTSGVALFLSKLLDFKDDIIIHKTLVGTINQIMSSNDFFKEGLNYAYFGGKIGIADTLIQIGKDRNNQDWENFGWNLLKKVCKQKIGEFEVDIISGVTGALPILIKRFNETNDVTIGQAINSIGSFLIEKATKTETYWSWVTISGQPAMTGYSHGASGVATSLLELYNLTKDPTYLNAAKWGFNFENINFNQQAQNWPDLRVLDHKNTQNNTMQVCGESWCHGAPGIGLSRLRAWELIHEDQYKQEAIIGFNSTHRNIYNSLTNQSHPSNFSLCHGLAGNADILLEGGMKLQNDIYLQVAYEVGNYGIEKYEKNGLNWPSGINDPNGGGLEGQETPGLLVGLAGTGYFYLRLAFPKEVPTILLLKSTL